MGRHKAISDDDLLRIAREVFRHHGHTATTRQIAAAAGISEPILYQRFGNKENLFFAAMRPAGPDVDGLVGPDDPSVDAKIYLQGVVARMGNHFTDVIPQALHLMTHPSFDPHAFARNHPKAHDVLHEALAGRLAMLVRRKLIKTKSTDALARILISLAHDWALSHLLPHGSSANVRGLKNMADVIWEGLAP